ncbi:MAG: YkgJ family cysteine cluster protein [Planctomycetota bacterium]|nr:YkgJ family cysteine cluster protein [Planctomycetota bacterium]
MNEHDVDSEQEWYHQGLRFECTQCGNCCTGPPGYIWFEDSEAEVMAESLGLTVAEFRKRHARRVRGRWTLNERKTEHGFDCVFLDRESVPGKAICGMYKTRPGQCRTWPFWSENIDTPETWENVKRSTPCPGIGQGQLITIESIRIQRDETSTHESS